jgi:serine/threonine protein phosphatase PrpC
LRIECYGATRKQDGHSTNEDAFLIGRGSLPFAALCDGAGNAEKVAKKVLTLFQRMFNDTRSEEAGWDKLVSDDTWAKWIHLLDQFLLDSGETTFLGVVTLDNLVVGAYVGDSRAYLIDSEGGCRLVTATENKYRLGSGLAMASPIHVPLKPRDVFLLLSDGAWMPLSLYLIQRAVVNSMTKHFSDVPQAVLDAAGRTGRADDMTAVALRITEK